MGITIENRRRIDPAARRPTKKSRIALGLKLTGWATRRRDGAHVPSGRRSLDGVKIRKIGRRVFCGGAVALASTRAYAAEPPSDVTVEEDFDELWRTLAERYCYFAEKTTDWQKVRTVYRPLAMAARTDEEFVDVMRATLAELYDAHTHLSSPPPGAPRWPGYDLVVERVADVARIVAVEEGSSPASVGLRPGDQILAIDNVAIATVAAKHMPRCLARPDPAAESYAWNVAVAGLTGQPRVLSIRDAQNKTTRSVTLSSTAKTPEVPISSNLLDGGLGYIRIATFANRDASGDFDRALAQLRETRGLIIDVRRNGGGDTAVARPIMGRFITQRKPYAKMRRRSGAVLGMRGPNTSIRAGHSRIARRSSCSSIAGAAAWPKAFRWACAGWAARGSSARAWRLSARRFLHFASIERASRRNTPPNRCTTSGTLLGRSFDPTSPSAKERTFSKQASRSCAGCCAREAARLHYLARRMTPGPAVPPSVWVAPELVQ
nr:S41 family peptidase [Labilithrix luteola]